tara:strand:- start:415 stop:1197 length:783 start_codon:yes stop_codon:yes gene_type:complete
MKYENFDIISKEELKKILSSNEKKLDNVSSHRDVDYISNYCLDRTNKYSKILSDKIDKIKKNPSEKNLKKFDRFYGFIKKKPSGYWQDLDNCVYEAKKLMEEHEFDKLPSKNEIMKAGYGSLNYAINEYHGGFDKLKELLDEKEVDKHYKSDIGNFDDTKKINNMSDRFKKKDKNTLEVKLFEVYKLRNKIDKYSRKLIFEGFNFASKNSLDLSIEQISEKYVDAEPLINMTKDEFPTLFRKYNLLKDRYFNLLEEIEKM